MLSYRAMQPQTSPFFNPLLLVYDFIEQWHRSLPRIFLACARGCASCCTSQVTATEVEARLILAYPDNKPDSPPRMPEFNRRSQSQALLTTNEFAAACLDGREIEHPALHDSPGECPFLDRSKNCIIYPVRPLMCRLFVSRKPCGMAGEAVVPEPVLTLNIVLQQLVEHLSRGYRWGNLAELLHSLSSKPSEDNTLRHCIGLPGLLIAPEEKAFIEKQLQALWAMERNNKGMKDYMGEELVRLFHA